MPPGLRTTRVRFVGVEWGDAVGRALMKGNLLKNKGKTSPFIRKNKEAFPPGNACGGPTVMTERVAPRPREPVAVNGLSDL
ncbi:hypothetical protein BOX30_01770 [Leptospirillum ferriphilum]|nr:hypothetical protein BOX30_01770 [Leptospirillum ferriphilum]